MKKLLPIILLFLFNITVYSQNLNIKLELKEKKNLSVQYYSSNFINENGEEFVDFKLDTTLSFVKQDLNYILEIPYNSDYLIELYDSLSNNYKYIQVSSVDSLETNIINIKDINFEERIRIVVYYKEVNSCYVQFITEEP